MSSFLSRLEKPTPLASSTHPEQRKLPKDQLVRVEFQLAGEQLYEILTSSKYQTLLKRTLRTFLQCAKKGQNDLELGYHLFYHPQSHNLRPVQMTELGPGSIGETDKDFAKIDRADRQGYFSVIGMHTHPSGYTRELIDYMPSNADLTAAHPQSLGDDETTYVINPLQLISVQRSRQLFDLLIYQEDPLVFHTLRQIEEMIEEYEVARSLEELIQILQENHYPAQIAQFHLERGFSGMEKSDFGQFHFVKRALTDPTLAATR